MQCVGALLPWVWVRLCMLLWFWFSLCCGSVILICCGLILLFVIWLVLFVFCWRVFVAFVAYWRHTCCFCLRGVARLDYDGLWGGFDCSCGVSWI